MAAVRVDPFLRSCCYHYGGKLYAGNYWGCRSGALVHALVTCGGQKSHPRVFFFEHATRRVYLADCTDHPDSAWVSQQARQMTWELQERTSVSDKELEILLLRRQLAIYERKHPASVHRTHLRRRHTAVRALPFEAVGGPFSVDSNGPILRDVRGS